jgi:hypothetical protein
MHPGDPFLFPVRLAAALTICRFFIICLNSYLSLHIRVPFVGFTNQGLHEQKKSGSLSNPSSLEGQWGGFCIHTMESALFWQESQHAHRFIMDRLGDFRRLRVETIDVVVRLASGNGIKRFVANHQ